MKPHKIVVLFHGREVAGCCKGGSLTQNTHIYSRENCHTRTSCSAKQTSNTAAENKRVRAVSASESRRTEVVSSDNTKRPVIACVHRINRRGPYRNRDIMSPPTYLNRGIKATPFLLARRLRTGNIDTNGIDGDGAFVVLARCPAVWALRWGSPDHNQDTA